jgi:hypothetical protein
VIVLLDDFSVPIALLEPKFLQPVPQRTKNFQLAGRHELPAFVYAAFNRVDRRFELQPALLVRAVLVAILLILTVPIRLLPEFH